MGEDGFEIYIKAKGGECERRKCERKRRVVKRRES